MTLLGLLAEAGAGEAGRYLDLATFLEQALPGEPEPEVVWVDAGLRAQLEHVLEHEFALLRVRYWRSGDTTAWVLDEVGKEQPITIGISVAASRVAAVRILEFRESRGWEVRYPFFTGQFDGARLVNDDRLDQRIDGITGATLSVRAVSRAVATALLLDAHVTGVEPLGELAAADAN